MLTVSVPAPNPVLPRDNSPTAATMLGVFFLTLPFAYLLQISTHMHYAGAMPYLLLAGSLALLIKKCNRSTVKDSFHLLSVGFFLLTIHHLVTSLIMARDEGFGLAMRVLVLFTLPLVLFWVPQAIGLNSLIRIFKAISIGAAIVATELLYENVTTQILGEFSFFQLLNKAYLNNVHGKDLTQLYWPTYRATGLLEHPHATAFFCNIGTLSAALLYIFRGRLLFLACSVVCVLAVWTQGFRLPVLAQIIVMAMTLLVVGMEKDITLRRRAGIFVSWFLASCLFVAIVDPTHVTHKYYLAGILGNFQLAENIDVREWLRYTASELITLSYWWKWLHGEWQLYGQALFGHGLVGTLSGRYIFSDDLFILALPLQYGLLGTMVFAGVWISAIGTGFRNLIHYRSVPLPADIRMAGLIALAALTLLALSMAHSGVLQRKAIFPFFPFFAGTLAFLNMLYRKNRPTGPVRTEKN